MKLYVLRHAKAEQGGQADHARVLAPRGHAQAAVMGEYLADKAIDFAIVSDSARTRETFTELGLEVPVIFRPEAYNASANELEQIVRDCAPVEAQAVVIIAHNPGMSVLAGHAGCIAPLQTCGLAVLDVDGPWSNFTAELSRCVETFRPEV